MWVGGCAYVTECMKICIFDLMQDMEHVPRGIGDEQLASNAPLVRALVVERLELIWRTCQPHIEGLMGKPDPRYVEAGIRVLDRLMRLYRLDTPAASADRPLELGDRAQIVLDALDQVRTDRNVT